MEADRAAEIAATFRRIHRPLRWPMENFARTKIANRGFVGYRFSRVSGRASAGFAFGFALRNRSVPGVQDPPEVVAHAFAGPVGSSLHRRLTARSDSAARLLVASDFLMLSYAPLRASRFLERVTKATTRPG